MSDKLKQGAWFSAGNFTFGEIVAGIGYDFVVLDVEHGAFDLSTQEKLLPYLKSLGLEVYAKVLVPERGAIQQPLDFGADGVIVPHIESFEHAELMASYTKFPPHGTRSLAGGRNSKYGAITNEWLQEQDRRIKFFPMVEDPGALNDIEKIAALDTVDGLFIGPGDLSIMSGRGAYSGTEADFEDFRRVANAARANEKPWMLPAWTPREKEFAIQEQADYVLLIMQHAAVRNGYGGAKEQMDELIKQAQG